VSVHVARARELVARGFPVAAVARVMQRRSSADPVKQAIVEEALATSGSARS
jgi:hypothetical protein